ncbi:cation:proton antiporter [Candidatus Wolfebacteria bacterium]|nr:cation:proton antiporter [Candidatus Wolfebacteria bacterium]
MSSGIFDLAFVVGIAAALGILGRFLKQPIILTYIVTGLLIGLFGYFKPVDHEIFQTFADLGIMFLLFLIGLEINYDSLRLVGRISVIVGLLQIAVTSLIGYFIALAFGFSPLEALYIAVALTFSSTVIVVKLLSEKKDLNSLYGKITVGFLLVQDFVAILILIALAGAGGEPTSRNALLLAAIKGVILFSVIFTVGRRLLPALLDRIAASKELLFLTGLAWCFGVAAVTLKAGFSVEIGGFLAGITLANSWERYQIGSRMKSLRDFFILIFFVILGSSLASFSLAGLTFPIIALSLFVLIGNPLIVLAIMGLSGYRKRTAFLCGVAVAQISEFSFVLMALGLKLDHVSPQAMSLITAVGIVTIAVSSYLIMWSESIFRMLHRSLSIFERRRSRAEVVDGSINMGKPIILIGCHRLGRNILHHLEKSDVLIIDFDPDIVALLRREGYATLFGDISDLEIFERAEFSKTKLVISTSPDFEDNARLLVAIKALQKPPIVIVRAEDEKDTERLYAEGANYVILPYLSSGQFIGQALGADFNLKNLEGLRKRDQRLLAR